MNARVHWNGGLLHALARRKEKEFSEHIQNALNTKVLAAAESHLRTALDTRAGKELWSHTKVNVVGTTIRFIVDTTP